MSNYTYKTFMSNYKNSTKSTTYKPLPGGQNLKFASSVWVPLTAVKPVFSLEDVTDESWTEVYAAGADWEPVRLLEAKNFEETEDAFLKKVRSIIKGDMVFWVVDLTQRKDLLIGLRFDEDAVLLKMFLE